VVVVVVALEIQVVAVAELMADQVVVVVAC
jgi:hypothetical protein